MAGHGLRKVLLVAGAGGPPLHYRVHQKVEQLRLAGIGSAVYSYTDLRLPAALEESDAVIIYRAPATKELLSLIDAARGRGLPTFYDVDDLVFDPEAIAELPIHGKRPQKEKQMWVDNARRYGAALQACGRGIASTPELARHMRRLGVRADVHPNGVDTTLAVLSEGARRQRQDPHDQLTIAYCSGTDTHDADLAMVGDVLSEFLGAHPSARLILAGPLEIPPVLRSRSSRVELRGVVGRQRFVRWFADFDLNLAPLVEHTFTECKSSIKWSEAALVEVPTLASATEPFRESIDHQVTGLLASRAEEFADGLRWAAEDLPRLRQMGRAARDAAYLTGSPWRLGTNLVGILTSEDAGGGGVGSFARVEDWPSESADANLEPAGLVGGDFPAGVPMRPGQRLDAGPVAFELPDGTAAGPLRRVDVHVATWGGPAAGPVSLAIRTGSEILAEATAPADSIQDNGWAAFEFSPGVATPVGARAEMRSAGGGNVTPYVMPYGYRIAAGRRRRGMVAAKTYYGVLEPPAFGREMLSPAWGGRMQVRAGRAVFRLTKGLAVGRRILRNPRSLVAELGRIRGRPRRRGQG
ncbi:MAG: glycosyltransferase [Candidatus Dormibacteraceae bacterium]